MRTIALGEAWVRAGGRAEIITGALPDWLAGEARDRGIGITEIARSHDVLVDARTMRSLMDEHDARWVVLDGYGFGPEYQAVLERSRVAVIDDHATMGPHHAAVVIDQNVGADHRLYVDLAPKARLLLGSDYAMLRSEFESLRPAVRHRSGGAPRVLVSLGGSPSEQLRGLARATVAALAAEEMVVDSLEGGDSRDVARRMAQADVAISTAGSTAWELCCLKVPAVLIVVADNQEPVATRLAERDAAISLGSWQQLTPGEVAEAAAGLLDDVGRWQAISIAAGEIVDGHGARRVVECLAS